MDTGHPVVSVIIPAYNAGRYLAETIDSVLSQTYRNFELIVIDDGSTDNTREIVAEYGSRVVCVHQENSGAPARPRNVGIARAKGRYISFFDSDDVMLPDKLERSVAFIERHPELGMMFTDFIQFTDAGDLPGTNMDRHPHFRRVPKRKVSGGGYIVEPRVAFEALFHGNYVGTSSVIVPTAIMKEVGGFDEEVSRGGLEDRDMWFRIARRFPIGYLDIVGHRYRVRPGSVSRDDLRSAEARIKVIRRHGGTHLSRSAARQARRLVAESAFTVGYQLCLRGDVKRARRYLWESAAGYPRLCAWRWLMLSFMGSGFVRTWLSANDVKDRMKLEESV